ncbi:hypothetical protein HYQ45_004127 [Verticillium longisporum]|uniref:F-box domain-containing protein n=1 Tax=Verticillium longisporum TaxID=100787 RepID=A0A8I2ZTR8_VERLO|nr:hypothetical protein HYQ45_004127 [Verticillium longisporum]
MPNTIRKCLRSITKAWRRRKVAPCNPSLQNLDQEQNDTILQLPLEMILHITTFLDDSDMTALALCCKCLYRALPLPRLPRGAQREDLLLRLERDMGDQHLYCTLCSKVHDFSLLLRSSSRRERYPCLEGRLRVGSGGYNLPYHHGLAMMNRHLYGAPRGIPLTIHETEFVDRDSREPCWTIYTTMYVVRGELMLVVYHEMRSSDLDTLWQAVDEKEHWICNHRKTNTPDLRSYFWMKTYYDAKRDQDVRQGQLFCFHCLTDYMVMVTLDYGPGPQPARIRINSFHLAGSFRRDTEWKWLALADETSSFKRDMTEWPRTAVSRMWETDGPARTAHRKRLSQGPKSQVDVLRHSLY